MCEHSVEKLLSRNNTATACYKVGAKRPPSISFYLALLFLSFLFVNVNQRDESKLQ